MCGTVPWHVNKYFSVSLLQRKAYKVFRGKKTGGVLLSSIRGQLRLHTSLF
jgi:hypothetical protein